ncbi:MAG: hypothetical protein ACRD0B_04510 [Acidimicrobiales bacterium]
MTGGGAGPKRKGSVFERDVVGFLREHGFPDAARSYGAGRHDDHGDVTGVWGFTVEAKAHRAIDLAAFLDQAVHQVGEGGDLPVVVAKRRGRPVDDAYVVMRLSDWAALAARRQPGE